MRARINSIPKGLTVKQMGIIVAAATATAALPISMTTSWLHLRAPVNTTETVWMGLTSTVSSLTGYGFQSGTVVEMPVDASTNTFYFQSQSGSSTIHYIALGVA